jgi:Spy/CpxP family protein refolding chaperone
VTANEERFGAESPASAFSVAERLLDGVTLTPSQIAQLRAIDHKYQQSLYSMLHGARRAPTEAERSQLDDTAVRDIMEMLTPEQRTRCAPE